MTNGLVKERMTYFHKNGIAYQAFNTMLNTAKILIYVPIDGGKYIYAADMLIDHKITKEELELIAI